MKILSETFTNDFQLIHFFFFVISFFNSFDHSTGRGVFANQTIEKSELLLSLPLDLMITPETAGLFLDVYYPPWKEMKLDCHGILALFLALELRRGERSDFSMFLNSLPPSFDMVLANWPDEYDKYLMTNIVELKTRFRQRAAYRYNVINEHYNKEHLMTWIREEEIQYALNAINTRAFNWPYGTGMTLLPGNWKFLAKGSYSTIVSKMFR